jgi:hypothetical protein
MGERPRVLGELSALQPAYVGNALDRPRAFVGGKFLVAKNGQALLEAELEPVAASNAVAGPVVKILVRDDRFDMREIRVGRRLRRGQDVFVVKDVEALVLHRAHVEV